MKSKHSLLRKILAVTLCLCMLSTLVACKGKNKNPDDGSTTLTTGSTTTQGTEPSGTNGTEPSGTQGTEPSGTQATEPKPTEPKPTEPKPTEPKPTEPKPTEPKPTEPQPTEPADPNAYKHVIVINVDGAGAFFENADTPNLDRIFANGAITYEALTESPSISAQCWGAMLHGVSCKQHKLTNSIVESKPYPTDSRYPSFFRVVRENDANAKMGAFSNWKPINTGIIENGLDVYKVGGVSDANITKAVCDYVSQNAPKLVFVQFDEADAVGHSSGYDTNAQYKKITAQDALIGQIYQAYVDKGIIDDTLFIVTADHGGFGNTHGGNTYEEMHIMFAATGKTVQKGTIQDMEVRDTASIVLHAFGYKQPETWTSRVPSGLFKGVTAGERPVYVDKNSERYHESTPTPAKNSAGYITNFVKDVPLKYYLTFDGTVADACGNQTAENGKLYYVDGYYGKGASMDDGYVSIKNYSAGTDSFSVGMWVNTTGVSGDPALFSNKNWASGVNKGFILSMRNTHDITFNLGNGSSRMDMPVNLPTDYDTGWVYILLVVDRDAGQVKISYDFDNFVTSNIPSSLKTASADAMSVLNIGQDGTGDYLPLSATIDEFMYFDGALDSDDVAQLKAYFGK